MDRHQKKKVCPKCDARNFEFAHECEECGTPLVPIAKEPAERRGIWDSWLGILMATGIILLTLLLIYLLLTP